ncbi:MAG: RluA family pseudouridine synthase, partial [Bacilli bacterium]|nr:RluA family pseudouridine synthase [Bacilli bacterium]
MNKNDPKRNKSRKGLVDPSQIKVYPVKKETELLVFLLEKMAGESRNTVKRILANQQVSVGGAPVTQFNFKLYPEDEVVVSKRRIVKHSRADLPILYEDDDIVVINKPSGLLSIASDREKGKTAYRMVSDYIAQKDPKGRIFVIHRLDEDTSGVLMFAKRYDVKEAYQKSWQNLVRKRGYYAIVEGKMEQPKGTFKDYLEQNSLNLVYVSQNKVKGKLSITSYEVMKEKGDYSLL